MHSTCLKQLGCCPWRRLENSPSKGLAISCRHVALFTHPVIPACVGLTTKNPATAPGFLLPRIQPSGDAHEAESQKQSAGARQNGMGGGRTPSWRDRLLAPSTHRRVFASRCRHGLADPQKESVVSPVARTALGKAWTSIAGSATYENNTGSPCTLTSMLTGWRETGTARSMQ